ncbi:SRPBCC family protein [Actinomadura atramentaria]|uniref:SRPBCC family protein n=1 Tax=Actinomadura atramentaria TaxID=1990 RepID=UPI00037BA2DD|nr:SRPBCC family protein [Actinomadura atramentaria]
MEYQANRRIPAGSAIVFDVAADLDAMRRWLPEEIQLREIADDLVEASSTFAGTDAEHVGLLRRVPAQLRLEWGLRERPDYSGWLQVEDQADGASEVVVHLSFLGHERPEARGASRAVDRTNRMLERSLDRLTEEVLRRVPQ